MAVSLLHLSLGTVEEERPPGHGVGPLPSWAWSQSRGLPSPTQSQAETGPPSLPQSQPRPWVQMCLGVRVEGFWG